MCCITGSKVREEGNTLSDHIFISPARVILFEESGQRDG